jgi:prepilin-type N-terminal cleavage/methylation domain-containing protein
MNPRETELYAGRGARASDRGPRGFTLIEITIVLVLAAVMLGLAGLTFGEYFRTSSARQAGQIFARDLSLARSAALRSRETVVVRFDETGRWYQVAMQSSGRELVTRRFGVNADIALSGIDLRLKGDTVTVSPRGIVDLSGILGPGSLGEARFAFGATEYSVYFNSMGASKVEER